MRRRSLTLVVAVVASLGPASAGASPIDFASRHCLEQVVEMVNWIAKIPIPVGCHLVDCCPGCPAAAPLDWRVRVSGAVVDSLGIAFEDLAHADRLSLEGDAQRIPNGAQIGPGGGVLRGLGGTGDRVAVATLELRLDRAAVAELQKQALESRATEPLDTIEVSIDQLLGSFRVDELRIRMMLVPCSRRPGCDVVVQQNNASSDASVLLLDGRRQTGCSSDEVVRGVGAVEIGDLRTPQACRSELAVFSEGDALELRAPEASWTDACLDMVSLELSPRLQMPVTVWWVNSIFSPNRAAIAQADVSRANEIYDRSKTGIAFHAQYKVVPDSAVTKVTLGCVSQDPLPTNAYDTQRINVYYTNAPITGESCKHDRNRIFVGLAADSETLAHELGHALSLHGNASTGGHTNGLPGFTSQNVMWASSSVIREWFTLGQAFRLSVDPRSMLNANGVRSGVVRPCDPLVADDACPKLELDWTKP